MSLKLDGTTGTGNNSITCDASNNLLYNGIKLITVNNADDLIPVATISAAGLMSSSDKRKLSNLEVDTYYLNNNSTTITIPPNSTLLVNICIHTGSNLYLTPSQSGIHLTRHSGDSTYISTDGTTKISGYDLSTITSTVNGTVTLNFKCSGICKFNILMFHD